VVCIVQDRGWRRQQHERDVRGHGAEPRCHHACDRSRYGVANHHDNAGEGEEREERELRARDVDGEECLGPRRHVARRSSRVQMPVRRSSAPPALDAVDDQALRQHEAPGQPEERHRDEVDLPLSEVDEEPAEEAVQWGVLDGRQRQDDEKRREEPAVAQEAPEAGPLLHEAQPGERPRRTWCHPTDSTGRLEPTSMRVSPTRVYDPGWKGIGRRCVVGQRAKVSFR
jgi:hypothetical protein